MQAAMYPSSDDEMQDVGRLQSEAQMQNKAKNTYLTDFREEMGMDIDEVMETVDRERRLLDTANDNFLSSLEMSMHVKTKEKGEITSQKGHEAQQICIHASHGSKKSNHPDYAPITTLIEKSQDLLNTSSKAIRIVSISRAHAREKLQVNKDAMEKIRKKARKAIEAGKKVAVTEIDGYEADDEHIVATGVVGSPLMKDGESALPGGAQRVDACLTRLEKGVKKMSKVLE